MIVLQRGHRYELTHVGGEGTSQIQFVNKEPGQELEGVTTQEILRVLIDRTHYCNNCLPHDVNPKIIWHFRMALALHEARALEQKVAKGELNIERVDVEVDGHLYMHTTGFGPLMETELKPAVFPPKQVCDHRSDK